MPETTTEWPSGARREGRVVTMPPGEYWIGDPCYAMDDGVGITSDEWDDWLEDARTPGDEHSLYVADVRGAPVLGIGTAHGDGRYEGDDGFEYPVDAGLIGLVPCSLWTGDSNPYGMRRYVAYGPTACTYDFTHGTIVIGGVSIMTDPPDEPDYDEYGYDDEYEPEYPQGEDQ